MREFEIRHLVGQLEARVDKLEREVAELKATLVMPTEQDLQNACTIIVGQACTDDAAGD